MNYDLIKIKEKYGEKMMHLCKILFPTILEKEGQLFNLLESNFAYSKYLYEDIIENELESEFKNYIYSLNDTQEIKKLEDIKTPEELLSEAGYILYECKNEEDIQIFKKYYAKNEELCTFHGGRLNSCYVFFAVKKNVDEIKRENFKYPERQDEYGTSVISIQFSHGKINTLSIKNRYNHRVPNPDATFSNNLENIIPGLTESFEKKYNLNINRSKYLDFEIDGYVKAKDGKYYKYNHEINNIYYCPNNIIIDNFEVKNDYQEKEKYLIIDYFIIDLVNKELYLYDNEIEDSFLDGLNNIKKIEITKDKITKNKSILITFNDNTNAIIEVNKFNKIISYTNTSIEKIGSYFLCDNYELEKINIPNVIEIEDYFLCGNEMLTEIDFPKLSTVGNYFIADNEFISRINMPNLTKTGTNFLYSNQNLTTIYLPKLIEVDDNFLNYNVMLEKIIIPNIKYIGSRFFCHNKAIKTINMPNLIQVKHGFLRQNPKIKELIVPKLRYVGDDFLYNNRELKEIVMPKALEVENNFIETNETIKTVYMPNIKKIGCNFLCHNQSLTTLELPNVRHIDSYFLYYNKSLIELNLENVIAINNEFMYLNNSLEKINMPNLKQTGRSFLYNNNTLTKLHAKNLRNVGKNFLYNNKSLTSIDFYELDHYGINFCENNPKVKTKIKSIFKKN